MGYSRLALALLCAFALSLALIPAVAAPPPAPPSAKVAREVWDDTAAGRTAHFLVVLTAQADARRAAAGTATRQAQGRAVVSALRETAAASQPAVSRYLDAQGADYRSYWVVNALAVTGRRALVEALAVRADVRAIASDRPFRVALEQPGTTAPSQAAGVEWNVGRVNAPALWAKGYIGQGMVYANADTGVEWEHPALKSNYRGWDGAAADHNYSWWDAIHQDVNGDGANPCGFSSPFPCDDHGHGTHTLGTAVGDDGAGNQIGVAPGAKWIACRNMDDGVGRPSTYIECLQFFLAPTDLAGENPNPDLRPHAVGNSYGCPIGSPPYGEGCQADSLLSASDNLRAAGVVVAVSAGNSGSACATVDSPPAIYDSAITVGAIDENDAIAGFSSRGPVTVDGSGRRKPDLVAPGVGVRSSAQGGSYGLLSGTSMAAPHVGAGALLLWSAFPQLSRNVEQTEFVVKASALPLAGSQLCGDDTPGGSPNNVYGSGRLDLLAAYDFYAAWPASRALLPLVVK